MFTPKAFRADVVVNFRDVTATVANHDLKSFPVALFTRAAVSVVEWVVIVVCQVVTHGSTLHPVGKNCQDKFMLGIVE